MSAAPSAGSLVGGDAVARRHRGVCNREVNSPQPLLQNRRESCRNWRLGESRLSESSGAVILPSDGSFWWSAGRGAGYAQPTLRTARDST
jgi:hypothetical protein